VALATGAAAQRGSAIPEAVNLTLPVGCNACPAPDALVTATVKVTVWFTDEVGSEDVGVALATPPVFTVSWSTLEAMLKLLSPV
jgi:hypothetical protein